MKKDKLASYINFSIKSGDVIFGYDNIFSARKKPILVIYDLTLSNKMIEKLKYYCDMQKIKILPLENLILSDIIKRDNCKVLAFLNINLSKAIENELLNQ